MQDTSNSKFIHDVFRYDTNDMAGYQNNGSYNNQGQCQSNCCTKEQER
ncbi:MAG: hypothetical protein LBC03_01870 [Nitrososphaerota archaeon]|jgi:hypothetical protein|nr:hypothetical protein [Nitrososphaerota archaeon]